MNLFKLLLTHSIYLISTLVCLEHKYDNQNDQLKNWYSINQDLASAILPTLKEQDCIDLFNITNIFRFSYHTRGTITQLEIDKRFPNLPISFDLVLFFENRMDDYIWDVKNNPNRYIPQDIPYQFSKLAQFNYYISLNKNLILPEKTKNKLKQISFNVIEALTIAEKKTITSDINKKIKKETDNFLSEPLDIYYMLRTPRKYLTILYMKLLWQEPFEKSYNEKLDFKTSKSETLKHEFMRDMRIVKYMDSEHFQIISLPYDIKGMDMLFMLPKGSSNNLDEYVSLKDFWSSKNQELDMNYILREFNNINYWEEVNLTIPIFEATTQNTLNTVLGRVTGDLEGIEKLIDNDWYSQMTKIKVDNEGVTFVSETVSEDGMTPDTPFKMNLTRPFLYIIRIDKCPIVVGAYEGLGQDNGSYDVYDNV